MKGLDKAKSKLVKLISEKYATENGKKFILHLVSAFITDKGLIRKLTSDVVNSFDESTGRMKYGEVKCCMTKVPIVPADIYIPATEGQVSYGWISKKSDKMLSEFAFECLQTFVDMRVEADDDMITKIQNYINKKNESKIIKPVKKSDTRIDTKKIAKDGSKKPTKPTKSVKEVKKVKARVISMPVEPKDPRFAALKGFNPEAKVEESKPKPAPRPKVEKEIKESRAESEMIQAIPE